MRRLVRALIAATLLLLVVPLSAQAQDGPPIHVTVNAGTYSFGQQADFHVVLSAEREVTTLYFFLQRQGVAHTEAFGVPIAAGTEIDASHSVDLRLYPFPPFSAVTWWWEVGDAAGRVSATAPSTLQYVDSRYSWQSNSVDRVRVHTVVSDPRYVQTALDVAHVNLGRIEEMLQSPALPPVDIYIYPTLSDLRAALEMGGREWVGGQARPELGVILVAVPYNDEFSAQMERDIPHELTHLVVYHLLGAQGYVNVPAWLNEGLATANETWPNPRFDLLVEQADQDGRLIALRDLCVPFPVDAQMAELAYAQSASVVRMIRSRYGDSGIRSLLSAYGDGAGCAGGVERALGMTLEQLEWTWRVELRGMSGWALWFSDNALPLALWAGSLLLATPMVGILRRRTSAAA